MNIVFVTVNPQTTSRRREVWKIHFLKHTLMPLRSATKDENMILFSRHTFMPLWGATKSEDPLSKQKFAIEIDLLYFQVS